MKRQRRHLLRDRARVTDRLKAIGHLCSKDLNKTTDHKPDLIIGPSKDRMINGSLRRLRPETMTTDGDVNRPAAMMTGNLTAILGT